MTDRSVEDRLLDAALPDVPFDGWSETTFRRAIEAADVNPAEARAAFPRGAVDLALAFHRRGDRIMRARLDEADLMEMPVRARVRLAIKARIEAIEEKEAARRAATLLALPNYAADGTAAIWGTADAIWTALGDSSRDVNWYTKRATLSGVYASTFLFWLGDESHENQDTWAFLDRRVDDVMQIERLKGAVQSNPVLSRMTMPFNMLTRFVRAPQRGPRGDMPGGSP